MFDFRLKNAKFLIMDKTSYLQSKGWELRKNEGSADAYWFPPNCKFKHGLTLDAAFIRAQKAEYIKEYGIYPVAVTLRGYGHKIALFLSVADSKHGWFLFTCKDAKDAEIWKRLILNHIDNLRLTKENYKGYLFNGGEYEEDNTKILIWKNKHGNTYYQAFTYEKFLELFVFVMFEENYGEVYYPNKPEPLDFTDVNSLPESFRKEAQEKLDGYKKAMSYYLSEKEGNDLLKEIFEKYKNKEFPYAKIHTYYQNIYQGDEVQYESLEKKLWND